MQTLYHGLLLFVLPAYYAAATLTSVNIVFVALLVGAHRSSPPSIPGTTRSCIRGRGSGAVFFVVSIFAALNVALPLLGVRPYVALLLSAWAAVVAVTPAVRRAFAWPGVRGRSRPRRGRGRRGCVAGVWLHRDPARAAVRRARADVHWNVGDRSSRCEPVASRPSRADELSQRGLTAYTAIYAPAGLRQPVAHVWKQEGRVRTWSASPRCRAAGARAIARGRARRRSRRIRSGDGRWTS